MSTLQMLSTPASSAMKTCAEGGRHREVSSAANRGAAERVLRASLSAEGLMGEA